MYPYSLICHSLPHTPAPLTPFLTHSLTHPTSLNHSSLSCLTHSLIPLSDSLSVSLILCLAHFSATHFLTHSLPCFILSHSLHCLTHSLPHSLPTHSPGPLIYFLSHSVTNFPTSLTSTSLTHSLIHSLLHPLLCLTHSLIHSTVSFTSLSHSLPDLFTPLQYSALLFPPHHPISEWFEAHYSMTHWKLLSYSNSAITVIQSGCHRTHEILCYDGYMTALRGLHVVVLPS